MRLLRGKVPLVLDKYDYQFELGKAKLLEDGNDVLIISSGLMTMRALEAAEKLRADNIGVAVLHVPTIKPLDEKAIIEQASKPGRLVVTAENHTAVGGLGEAVAALLMRKGVRCELDSVGLPDAFLLAAPCRPSTIATASPPRRLSKKLSIVCVNRAAMTHWPLSALSGLLMPASQARHSFADFMRPVTKSARLRPFMALWFLPSLIAIISLKTTPFTGPGRFGVVMSFDSLGLNPDILRAVAEQGYVEPTPIQQQAIPAVLQGRDLMASAQTGAGKTAGFTLPLLQRLIQNEPHAKGRRPVRALILTPTRELAAQVGENVRDYSKYLNIRSLVVFGGVSINPQMMKLRGGVDILVATPGRLLDLEHQNAVSLDKVEILVLDEADRMLDMGFIHDIRRVLAKLLKRVDRICCSRRPSPTRSRAWPRNCCTTRWKWKWRVVTPRPSRSPSTSISLTRTASVNCCRSLSAKATGSRCWCLPVPSMAPTTSRNSSTKTASAARRSMATRARERVPARWPTLNPAAFACWWRPISPPAVWISKSCRTW